MSSVHPPPVDPAAHPTPPPFGGVGLLLPNVRPATAAPRTHVNPANPPPPALPPTPQPNPSVKDPAPAVLPALPNPALPAFSRDARSDPRPPPPPPPPPAPVLPQLLHSDPPRPAAPDPPLSAPVLGSSSEVQPLLRDVAHPPLPQSPPPPSDPLDIVDEVFDGPIPRTVSSPLISTPRSGNVPPTSHNQPVSPVAPHPSVVAAATAATKGSEIRRRLRYASASNIYQISFGGLSSKSENSRLSFSDSQELNKPAFMRQVQEKDQALQNERRKREEEKVKEKKRAIIKKIMDERRHNRQNLKAAWGLNEINTRIRSETVTDLAEVLVQMSDTSKKGENELKIRSKSASERPKEKENPTRPRAKSTSELLKERKRKANDGDWVPWLQPVVKAKIPRRETEPTNRKIDVLDVIPEIDEDEERHEEKGEQKTVKAKEKSSLERFKTKIILSSPVAATSAAIADASRFLIRTREKAQTPVSESMPTTSAKPIPSSTEKRFTQTATTTSTASSKPKTKYPKKEKAHSSSDTTSQTDAKTPSRTKTRSMSGISKPRNFDVYTSTYASKKK